MGTDSTNLSNVKANEPLVLFWFFFSFFMIVNHSFSSKSLEIVFKRASVLIIGEQP